LRDFPSDAFDELGRSELENLLIDADQLPVCRTLLLGHILTMHCRNE
jgi:hypothetical protein